MKLQTQLLRDALHVCGQVMDMGQQLQILSHVKMSATNGILLIESSSIQTYVTQEIPIDGEIPPICVSHGSLARQLKFEPDEIELSFDGKLQIRGRGRKQLNFLDVEEFPKRPQKGTPLAVNPLDLAEGLKAVAWAANPEKDSRCEDVLVQLKPKLLECCGFGGILCALFERPLICVEGEMAIHAEFIPVLIHALNVPGAEVFLSDNFVTVTNHKGSASAKLSEQKKFNPDNMRRIARGNPILISSEVLERSCHDAIALNDKPKMKSSVLHFEFTGKELKISSLNGLGRHEEEFELASEPQDFYVAAELLLKAIRGTPNVGTFNLCVGEGGIFLNSGDTTTLVSRNNGKGA